MGEHFTHRIINLDTLIQDLRDLGISSGDTVFIKGNLGAIGLPREIDGDIRKVFFMQSHWGRWKCDDNGLYFFLFTLEFI